MMNTAVLYRTERATAPLQPNQTAQLLQGFLNIQRKMEITTGELSQDDLRQFTAIPFADQNTEVADYFVKNFNQIAPLDGNADTISVNDLVVRRPELPRTIQPIIMPPNGRSGEGAECPGKILNPNDIFRQPV
jgi:hypothetical protein